MKAPDKILLVVTRRIGDVLLATPLIRSLHRAWPEAKKSSSTTTPNARALVSSSTPSRRRGTPAGRGK